jgi:hypothetical protein
MIKKKLILFFLCVLPIFTFLEREFFGVFLFINLFVFFFSYKRQTGLILFIYSISLIILKLDFFGLYFLLNLFILFFCFFDNIKLSTSQAKKIKIASFTIVSIILLIAPSSQVSFFFVTITVTLWNNNFRKNLLWVFLVLIISEYTGSRTSQLSILVYLAFKFYPSISNYISKNHMKCFLIFSIAMGYFYYVTVIDNDHEVLLYEYDPRLLVASLFFENINLIDLFFGTAKVSEWDFRSTNLINFDYWHFHHNCFITIISFAGIIGLLIFLYLFNNIVKNSVNVNFKYFFALLPFALFFDNFIFYPMITISIIILSKIQIINHEKHFN